MLIAILAAFHVQPIQSPDGIFDVFSVLSFDVQVLKDKCKTKLCKHVNHHCFLCNSAMSSQASCFRCQQFASLSFIKSVDAMKS